jgi:hypothetical protein
VINTVFRISWFAKQLAYIGDSSACSTSHYSLIKLRWSNTNYTQPSNFTNGHSWAPKKTFAEIRTTGAITYTADTASLHDKQRDELTDRNMSYVSWTYLLNVSAFRYIVNPKHKAVPWAQTVSPRPLTAEARVRSRISPCGVCGGQSGTGTGFSPSCRFSPVNFIPLVLH